MSSLVMLDVMILVLIILKTYGSWTFNLKYYILSQMFYKKIRWILKSLKRLKNIALDNTWYNQRVSEENKNIR